MEVFSNTTNASGTTKSRARKQGGSVRAIWIPELIDEASLRGPQELGGISSRMELSGSTPPTYEMSGQSRRDTADIPQSPLSVETR